MPDRIIRLYQKLFDLVKAEEKDELSIFVGKKGCCYDESPVKLMLIGRATNGWDKLGNKTRDEFTQIVSNLCQRQDGLNDFLGEDENLYMQDKDSGSIYNLNGSQFWNYTHHFYEQLTGMKFSGKHRWVDYIYWTNLHKLAPAKPDEKGYANPSAELQFRQMPVIREILKEEIETVRPTHILLPVGYDWFVEFNEGIFQDARNVGRNISSGPNKNNQYVEWLANYQMADGTKIPVVSVCRPERRTEELYIADVLSAWNK